MESKHQVDTFLLYNPKDKHYQKIASMAIDDVAPYLNQKIQELSK